MRLRERGATGFNPAWIRGPLGLGEDPTVPGGCGMAILQDKTAASGAHTRFPIDRCYHQGLRRTCQGHRRLSNGGMGRVEHLVIQSKMYKDA